MRRTLMGWVAVPLLMTVACTSEQAEQELSEEREAREGIERQLAEEEEAREELEQRVENAEGEVDELSQELEEETAARGEAEERLEEEQEAAGEAEEVQELLSEEQAAREEADQRVEELENELADEQAAREEAEEQVEEQAAREEAEDEPPEDAESEDEEPGFFEGLLEGPDEEEEEEQPEPNEVEDQAPEPEPEQIVLSGAGDTVTDPVAVESGLGVITMTHQGEANFVVEERGGAVDDFDSLMVNEIGSYSGLVARNLQGGEFYLDVSADGPWEIVVDQPRTNEGSNERSFSGETDSVSPFVELQADTITVDMEHSGQGNFVVRFLDEEGVEAGWDSLVANEIGTYSGSTTVEVPDDGTYILDIQADGPWSIVLNE